VPELWTLGHIHALIVLRATPSFDESGCHTRSDELVMINLILRSSLQRLVNIVMLNLLFQAILSFVGAAPFDTNSVSDKPMVNGILLWPSQKMPGRGATEAEREMPSRNDGVTRISNVSHPTLTFFRAPANSSRTPAIIVCPGGAYQYVVVNKEGSEIAKWLNSLGITACVLKYRVPDNRDGTLQDIERAVRLVRAHEKEWNLDDTKIGVMGFSAGGHLCAHLSTTFEKPAYTPVDAIDKFSCRPDFVVLVYPAYLGKDGKLAPELLVNPHVPPTFIAHSEDDTNYVWGTKLYAAALTANNIPHEFNLFQTGGHGYGLEGQKEARAWPVCCRKWLTRIKVLPPNAP
jgi:acetyl esterase/lipase